MKRVERSWLRYAMGVVAPLLLFCLIPVLTFQRGSAWQFDASFTAWVHRVSPASWGPFMKWVSTYSYHNAHFYLIGIVAVLFLLFRRSLAAPLALLAVRWGADTAQNWLKNIYDRPRPVLDWVAKQSSGFSYPSGSTTVGAAFCVMLCYLLSTLITDRRYRLAVQILGWYGAVLIAYSRVYLGNHWLTDTMGALCVAAALSTAVTWLFHSAWLPQLMMPLQEAPLRQAAASKQPKER
ncbi:MAG: phosphatase PAP2 family protein [Mycobacterium leprae]